MSSLTEEQRRRMEENRRKAQEIREGRARMEENKRKALELRAAAAARQQQRASIAVPQPTKLPPVPPAAQTSVLVASSCMARPATAPVPKSAPPPKALIEKQQQIRAQPAKMITGHAVMISNERFKIDAPYNSKLIELFKGIEGVLYDSVAKTWNFPLTSHKKLMTALQPFQSEFKIGGLPHYVLKIFNNVSQVVEPEPDLSKIDPTLLRTLMPFQREGVIFGINRGGRVLIADDMGLGKTVQALGIAHYYESEWPLLIVTTSSMRHKWREEIWSWLPSVSPGSIAVLENSSTDFSVAKIVITTYDLLKKFGEAESRGKFKVVIIDESHQMKNYKSARTKATTAILQNCARAILLSGTPALSRPIELFSQILSLNPNLFTANEFGMRYCNGKKSSFGRFGNDFTGASNLEELSLVLKATLMVRRLKSDVLTQLPEKKRKMVMLDSSLINLKAENFQSAAKEYTIAANRKGKNSYSQILKYYHETCFVKLPAVRAYVKSLVEKGKKFIFFAHHKDMLDGICADLEASACMYIRIDGTDSSEDRAYFVEQFQSNTAVKVAVLSITSASVGITLTAADLVIFGELFWNPGILTQAEDRVHRIGQEANVVIEYLLAEGTADDYLVRSIQKKSNVLNQVGLAEKHSLDETARVPGSNSRDIRDMFAPKPKTSTPSAPPEDDDDALFMAIDC